MAEGLPPRVVASQDYCSEQPRPLILPVQRDLTGRRSPEKRGVEQRNRTPEGEGAEKGPEGLYLFGWRQKGNLKALVRGVAKASQHERRGGRELRGLLKGPGSDYGEFLALLCKGAVCQGNYCGF